MLGRPLVGRRRTLLVVKIGTLHGQMKYDVESFQVKPESKVSLTFNNTDEMQHNLLILQPGADQAAGGRAKGLGARGRCGEKGIRAG